MLARTMTYLEQVNDAFTQLGYCPTSLNFSFEEIKDATIKTLNHTKRLDDGVNVIRKYQFLSKEFEKACTKINKHYDYWKKRRYKWKKSIETVSDEETEGVYFVTNELEYNWKKLCVCSHSFGDNCYVDINYRNSCFGLDDSKSNYLLRFSKINSKKMVILDRTGEKKCTVTMECQGICLQKNSLCYEIESTLDGLWIYKKNYLNSLSDFEKPKIKNACALIQWDVTDIKNNLGLARLELYDSNSDLELFLLFAASCLLLYRSEYKGDTALSLFLARNNLMRVVRENSKF
ncbi:MAG: hypothetical protein MR979_05750 [Mollicutes bacterium]|nr:hypothetical protein [Mollicutes bacterium]